MALVTKTYTFSSGAVVIAAEHNTNNDTLYNLVNGNIDNANISSSAAIVDTKLAQITTAGKVSGAAITSLSSIPSGAGQIPSANMSTNAVVVTGNQTVAGVKTFSDKPVLPATTPTGNEAANATYVDGKITTLGISKKFVSSSQSITPAALLTVAHGLGAVPVTIQVYMVCNIIEGGWAVNDVIYMNSPNMCSSGTDALHAVYADSTNIYMRISSNVAAILANKTTGVPFVATSGSWFYRFTAFA